jgi:hypothetical protein
MSSESKPFRIPHGKYWNEFERKWKPDPERSPGPIGAISQPFDTLNDMVATLMLAAPAKGFPADKDIRLIRNRLVDLIEAECAKTCNDCHDDCESSPHAIALLKWFDESFGVQK